MILLFLCDDLFVIRLFGRPKQDVEGRLLSSTDDADEVDLGVEYQIFSKGKRLEPTQMTPL